MEIVLSCRYCDGDIELPVGYEEGEKGYGSDADGRRGIDLPGYFYVDCEIPTHCPNPECNAEFSEEERKDMEKRAEKMAAEEEKEEEYYGYSGPDTWEEYYGDR